METQERILNLLSAFQPITLKEMESIRLMNRTDTKYLTTLDVLMQLLEVAADDYYVQVVAEKRINSYQTVYWDTLEYTYFLAHHNGRMPRLKMRVRTYLDTGDLYIEVKRKNNHGRTKKQRMKEVPVDVEHFLGLLHADERAYCKETIKPVLQNRFQRITLVNKDKTERLTIDYSVQYENLATGRSAHTQALAIIELKRDGNAVSPIQALLLRFRIKEHGYSKYCFGSILTNPALKSNLFKERLRHIDKLQAKVPLSAGSRRH